jgi:hypothetical protein
MVISFVLMHCIVALISVVLVHQLSRYTLGVTADSYVAVVVIAPLLIGYTSSSYQLGIAIGVLSVIAHILSVLTAKKYKLYENRQNMPE